MILDDGTGIHISDLFLEELQTVIHQDNPIDFLELSAEFWLDAPQRYRKKLDILREKYPIACHVNSISVTSSEALSKKNLKKLKDFLQHYELNDCSVNLIFQQKNQKKFDYKKALFTEAFAKFIASRILQIEDSLNLRIALETPKPHAFVENEINEIDFLKNILNHADCLLVLNIHHIIINCNLHQFDAKKYVELMPEEKIIYTHFLNHTHEKTELNKLAWELLEFIYQDIALKPTLYDRNHEIASFKLLLKKLQAIKQLQEDSD